MNISVRVLKMSAWTKVSMISRPYSATGQDGHGQGRDDAQGDLAAKMLPKSRIDSVSGLTNSSISSTRPTNRAMTPAPMPFLNS